MLFGTQKENDCFHYKFECDLIYINRWHHDSKANVMRNRGRPKKTSHSHRKAFEV